MAYCNKIQVLEYPSGIPADLFTNGALFLDVAIGFGIRQTRKLEELTEDKKISVSATLPIDLKYTTKNFIVLGKYINPNVHNFDFKPLKVIAYSSSNVLTHSLLYVLSHDEKSNNFLCELRDDESHWLIGSKKLKLNTVSFDPFTFTKANIEGNWPLNSYMDGDPGIYFPLAFYGAWKEVGQATIEDMRPWYNVYYLLKKGFAKIGWIFKSPLFDVHPIGKKLITYLIEPFDISKQQKERPNTFAASLVNEEVFNTPTLHKVIFDTEEYDTNSVYDSATGEFSAQGIFNISYYIFFKGILDEELFGIEHKARLIKESNGTKTILSENYGTPAFVDDGNGRTYTVNDEFRIADTVNRISLNATDKVYVELSLPGKGERITSGNYYNQNNGFFLQENDTFKANIFIGNQYRLYDLLLGICHMFRIKIHTDHNRREIHLFPNYKVKWYDTEVEGYYINETVDLTEFQQVKSSVVNSQAQESKRFHRFQYKESTDARIIGLNYPKDKPIFSKTHDIGQYFENDIEVHDNPFFEPTVNDKVFSIRPTIIAPSNEYHIDLPFCVDNDEGLPSFDIKPRILIAHGLDTYEGLNGQSMAWRWYNTTQTLLPYCSMLPNLKKAGEFPEESIVYGDHKEDLFSRFWKRWVYDTLVNTKVNILAHILPKQFHSYSFRKVYHIFSNGKSVYGHLFAINDFDGCGSLVTPIDIIPSTGNVKAPVLEERSDGDYCAGQNPILTVTKSGDTYTAAFDPSEVTDTIISSVIEWRYFDVSTWTTGAVVANPTKPFYFKVTVVTATCGTKVRLKYVVPCENVPVIIWTNVHRDPFDNAKWCITATIGGILNDPILSSSFTISLAGATPIAYTIGTEICGIVAHPTEIDIKIIGDITFDNPCPPEHVESEYEFPPIIVPCQDNLPTVSAFNIGNGMFKFDKSGTWVSKLSVYFIQYRNVGDNDNQWVIWNDERPAEIPGQLEYRGVFFWCDTCPPICTEPVTIMEPMSTFNIENLFNSENMAATYEWDWSKLNIEEKQKVKEWYKKSDWISIATIINYRMVSSYNYCCGDDQSAVLKHTKHGIDNGFLDA